MEPNSPNTLDGNKNRSPLRFPLKIAGVSWSEIWQTVGLLLLLCAVLVWGTMHFVASAPPRTITISAGPKGSTFEANAERYQKILARNGVTLKILESQGSIDNLHRLADPKSKVDIALVVSGLTIDEDTSTLESLGSLFYQPLTIFYRSPKQMKRLSELQGGTIAIGTEGTATRFIALAMLKQNEIEPGGATHLLDLEGEDARKALLHRQADAIFLSGDSSPPATVREMLHADGVRLFDFEQANAYVRRFPYIHKLEVPAGAFDLGENLPPTDINLLAPSVELLARSNLHPAICDLLIEAAKEVHNHASVLQQAGQFPTPLMHTYPVNAEAARYYKEGDRSFAYRYLPFWLASLLNRAIVVLVPIFVVVIPSLKYLPQLYRWRINASIHKRYGELMALEREALRPMSDERRSELLDRLRDIEKAVIKRRIPGSHAEQLYLLRQHIGFVRENLNRETPAEPAQV
ncbi:MAG: C4-dicarboxylate ABC transporter substrate-binding protein [Sinobacteraceae bacterium]|nr:C4-dicarboxylate ABC transporter substrate-binding protein [Nevskiaceae bacterium]